MPPTSTAFPPTRQLRAAAVLTASLAWSGLCTSEALTQDRGGLYSLPRSQDDLAELERAQQELDANKPDAAVQRLHDLLRSDRHGVVPSTQGIDRYLGLRHAVIRALSNLEGDGAAAYTRLVEREAGHLLQRPFESLRNEELEELAQDFPTSKPGIRARLRLGDLALERGAARVAQNHYRSIADVAPDQRGLASRREAARLLAGAGAPRDEAFAERIREVSPFRDAGRWPAYGGGGDGTRGMFEPVGSCPPVTELQINALGFIDHYSRPTAFSMHPVGDLRGVYINNGISVWALDPLGRSPRGLWRGDGPMTDVSLNEFEEVAEAINPDTLLTCAFDDDLVIGALMVPNVAEGAGRTHNFKGSINIIRSIASRRLFAWHRDTGEVIWQHFDSRGGPITNRFSGHDVCGSPLIEDGVLYVPTYDQTGAIAYYVSAYDAGTGEPLWRRLVCSSGQEVNMFGNARQEFAAAPLALHEGVLYGTTNLGVCYAANAHDGSLRWVAGYDTIPLPPTRLRDQRPRQVYFANNPPAIVDGVLCCTPLDSEYALGIDIETGRLMWRMHHRTSQGDMPVRWLLGTLGDEFIFTGHGIVGVEARPRTSSRLDATDRVIASPEVLGESSGYRIGDVPRGALTEDRIWFLGSNHQLLVLDNQGNLDARRNDLAIRDFGNLLLADGIAVTAQSGDVTIHADVERMLEAAERNVRTDSADLGAHARLADLAYTIAAASKSPDRMTRAIEIQTRALSVANAAGLGEGTPLVRRIADARFDLSLTRARLVGSRDMSTGRRLLIESRDAATRPAQWLEAQEHLFRMVSGRELVQELDATRERFGDEEFDFAGAGPVPIAAYCLWQSIEHVTPAEGALRCQELLDRYARVEFDGVSLGVLAADRMATLLAKHGGEIYAPIEEAAAAALRAAGNDPVLVEGVARRYPHSQAAGMATTRLLDIAIADGNLRSALEVFASHGTRSPGTMRRMMVAAKQSGNAPLATALGQRLAATYGQLASDFDPDAGRTYAQIERDFAGATPTPSPTADGDSLTARGARPIHELGLLPSPSDGSALKFWPTQVVSGFESELTAVPWFATAGSDKLLAFATESDALTDLPTRLSDAVFSLPLYGRQLDRLVRCGDRLIVAEHTRVRGVELSDGAVVWSLEPEDRRQLTCLGVHGGIVLVYSALLTGGDGGLIFGLEPNTGIEVYRRRLPPTRDSFSPVAGPHGVWYWQVAPEPKLVQIDPLDGSDRRRIPLPAEALTFLGLEGRDIHRIHDLDLQTRILVHDDHIVIPAEADSDGAAPRLIAIDFDGNVRWRWTDPLDNSIGMVAAHDGRTVVLTSGSTSRLTILDAGGRPVRPPRTLGRNAKVCNWHHDPANVRPAPDVVAIRENPGSPSLWCIALGADKPRFERRLTDVTSISGSVVVGENFAIVPVRSRTGQAGRLIDIDFGNPFSADNTYLPRASSRFQRPLHVFTHGSLTIIQSPRGLSFAGPTTGENR